MSAGTRLFMNSPSPWNGRLTKLTTMKYPTNGVIVRQAGLFEKSKFEPQHLSAGLLSVVRYADWLSHSDKKCRSGTINPRSGIIQISTLDTVPKPLVAPVAILIAVLITIAIIPLIQGLAAQLRAVVSRGVAVCAIVTEIVSASILILATFLDAFIVACV